MKPPVKNIKSPSVDELPIINRVKHFILSATDGCYRTEHLLSLYVDGQLSRKLVAEVESHLENCASCKAALVIMQATHQVLMNREPVAPPAYLSERLRQAIAIEATKPVLAPKKSYIFGSRLALGSAGLAAAAVFAFLLVHQGGHPTVPSPGRQLASNSPAPAQKQPTAITSPHKQIIASAHRPLEQVAELPRTIKHSIGAVHVKVKAEHNAQTLIAALPAQHITISKVRIAQPVAVASQPKPRVLSVTATPSRPMVASVPQPTIQAPAVVQQQLAVSAPQTQPQQVQTVVADNVAPVEHDNVNGQLKMIASRTQIKPYMLDSNHGHLTEAIYSPGLPITGSGID